MTCQIERLFASRRTSKLGGFYFSLRVVYATSHLPGDRSSEFAQLRMGANGWQVWGHDEDEYRAYRCAIVRAGRYAPLHEVLAHIRAVFMELMIERHAVSADIADDDAAYEVWARGLGDATGPGQDWDCNGPGY